MKLLQFYWGGTPSLPMSELGTVAMVEPEGREPRTMKVEGEDFSFLFYVIFMTMLVASRAVVVYSEPTNPSKPT